MPKEFFLRHQLQIFTKEIQYDLEFHATFKTLKPLMRLLTLIIWPHYVEAP